MKMSKNEARSAESKWIKERHQSASIDEEKVSSPTSLPRDFRLFQLRPPYSPQPQLLVRQPVCDWPVAPMWTTLTGPPRRVHSGTSLGNARLHLWGTFHLGFDEMSSFESRPMSH
ncbi:hypothetical protein VTI74DRAFT_11430 [Chaetomium olivicolor]